MKNTNGNFWSPRKKAILVAVGIPVLIGGWWAFRPEKLFINQRVSEADPASVGGEAEPLYTGKLESREHPTSGRTTIYSDGGGKKYLRLTDFATSNGPDVHVVLVKAEEPAMSKIIVPGNLEYVELGIAEREPRRSELRFTGQRRPGGIPSSGYLLRAVSCHLWCGEAGEILRRAAR